MNKYFKRIVIFTLILTLIVGYEFPSFANSMNDGLKTVYVDGIAYNVSIDKEFNITVESAGRTNKARLIIDKYGNGKMTGVKGQKRGQIYDVKINELNPDKIDVEIKSNGREIQKFNDKQDLLKDEYIGQALVIGGTVLAAALIAALIATGKIVFILGATFIAVTAVDYIIRNFEGFFECVLFAGDLYINPIDISRVQAMNRIRIEKDVYTFMQWDARSIVSAVGKGIVGPENHYEFWKFGTFYDHYHTGLRSGHIFYGLPRTRALKAS